jgi:ankyrin repeat protein
MENQNKATDLMRIATALAISLLLATPARSADDSQQLFQAVRNGDIAYVKAHLTKKEIEVRDRRGATPLMHAAAFGNLETMKLLLDAGADVNAANDFDATALLWAARDPEKARLLIERGANVNIQSKQGRTPLMVASLSPGGTAIVALMLAKGADVNSAGGRRGDTALAVAANSGNAAAVKFLLDHGADPNKLDAGGMSPLNRASYGKRSDSVRALLLKKVDVNNANTFSGPPQRNGVVNRLHITALHNASTFGPPDMVRDLLKAGANVNAPDNRGLTPLHFAVASDRPSIEIVRALLAAGADVNTADTTGETPLDWASKFGYPDVIAALKNAGGKRGVQYDAPKLPSVDPPAPVMAIQRSIRLLEASGAEFFRKSGCTGCHHQPLIARAQAAARAVGVAINEAAAKEQTLQMRSQWLALQEEFLQSINPGGGANRLAENLLGMKANGCPPDTITDSAIVDIAESQEPDGNWPAGEIQNRPPIAQGEIAATARIVRVLQEYPVPARQKEFDARIARARAWLKQQKPQTGDDFAMRLSGLTWARATRPDLVAAAKELTALQRSDGGWAANAHLKSDAYATGVALVALAESGVIHVTDAAYRRGVDYLLSTQFPDGSWHVRSRAIKFQPYFESGFPFGHDQWISTAATSWAVQAIALGVERPVTRELQSARLP